MKILREWWDSPQPDEPDFEELGDDTVTINLSLDFIINVEEDGYWDFYNIDEWLDSQLPWDGWTSDYYEVDVVDSETIIEDLGDILNEHPDFPEKEGTYKVIGNAVLVYDIEGLYSIDDSEGYTEVITEDVEIYFNKVKSKLKSVKFLRYNL